MLILQATEKDLKYITSIAKSHYEEIGFIPQSRYEKIASGQIPNESLILCWKNNEPVGFCYATHKKHTTKIQQILIQEDARRKERATNLFWQSIGFQPINTKKGGKKRNRIIQIYGKTTGGLLLNSQKHQQISY